MIFPTEVVPIRSFSLRSFPVLPGNRLLLGAFRIRRRTSFGELPVAVHESRWQQKELEENTGFDSDYLPPEIFAHRSVGSVQDGKRSSSPDSADHIRRFPLFHPVSGFAVRFRRTSRFDRGRESSASTGGHSPFPPVPDSLSGSFDPSRIFPAGILPVSCTSIFPKCLLESWRFRENIHLELCPEIPPFPRVPVSGRLTEIGRAHV